MKTIIKFLSILLCLSMVLSFTVAAFAAEEAATEVTIPEANAIGAAQEHNTYTAELYIVSGTICEVANAIYGNVYIQDAEGNKFYVYGLYTEDGTRYDKMDPQPAVGDTITVLGALGQYNGNAQMKNATMTAYVAGEGPKEEPAEPTEVTIPEANAIGAATGENNYTTEKYIVTGVICEIANTTYGNLYIQDAEGNKLYVYGLYDTDGNRFDKMDPQPAVGDTITVVSTLGNYKGAPQMKNATMTARVAGEGPKEEPAEPTEVTITEANAIGAAKEHNSYTTEKYIVSGVVVEVANETYGNLYIQDAEGNKLYIYGLYDADGNRYDKMDPKPVVGDTVTVVGVLGQYNGNPQMKNGTMTAYEAGEGSQGGEGNTPVTGDPIVIAVCAMLISAGAVAVVPKKQQF